MSDLKIGLVAEGVTDVVIIQAALSAILQNRDFILTVIQPEPTQPAMGTGWCGVLRWCDQMAITTSAYLSESPLFEQIDLLILHVDMDVLSASYADCGSTVQTLSIAKQWDILPVQLPCPPISNMSSELAKKIQSWLGSGVALGNKTVLCLPAQSSGTWLAAAVLPISHTLLVNTECNPIVESQLNYLPINQRIKKTKRDYESRAATILANWHGVKQLCSQAQQFEQDVLAIV